MIIKPIVIPNYNLASKILAVLLNLYIYIYFDLIINLNFFPNISLILILQSIKYNLLVSYSNITNDQPQNIRTFNKINTMVKHIPRY